MDIRANQLQDKKQRERLRDLAGQALKKDCRFLEIGSWCGDSTVVLADMIRQRDLGCPFVPRNPIMLLSFRGNCVAPVMASQAAGTAIHEPPRTIRNPSKPA